MMNLNLFLEMSFVHDLATKGYAVIPNVLTPEETSQALVLFRTWIDRTPQIALYHDEVSPYGIFKHFQAAHQEHAWFIRTRPAVQAPFRTLWNSPELTVSFDSSCWMKPELSKRTPVWTHTDQGPKKIGVHCYQGLVSLTANQERSLVVYEGSHLLHEAYMAEHQVTDPKDWVKIDLNYLRAIQDRRRVIPTTPGCLVLWDSRTFHQNQFGAEGNHEERIVQYVCYLPRSGCSAAQRQKRWKYFHDRRTTSHWPYPVHVNPLQPRSYSAEKKIVLDYTQLVHPDLSIYQEAIAELI